MFKKLFKSLALLSVFSLPLAIPFSSQAITYDENIFAPKESEALKPFGAALFSGQFAEDKSTGTNPEYKVQQGDEVSVSTWGMLESNMMSAVDNQGNIFIPQVGPVNVAGTPASGLSEKVRSEVKKSYPSDVEIYTNLKEAKKISVFVTGAVLLPGRFSGESTDSIFHFIDKAKGINPDTGSFRKVEIIRNKSVIETFDIYNFLIDGQIPTVQLKDNDTILITQKGLSVAVDGEVKNKNYFEFTAGNAAGADLIKYAEPTSKATHISVSGFRNGSPISKYLSLADFRNFQLEEGDSLIFHSSVNTEIVKVLIEGEHLGPNVIIAPAGTSLKEVLNQVKIDPSLTNWRAVKIERPEVAVQQKVALENSLRRLQETLMATSALQDPGELVYKAEEAKIVQAFVLAAKSIQPKGTVIVTNDGEIQDIKVKEGDRIIIPAVTNVVVVSGEVNVPRGVVFDPSFDEDDYINKSGGYSIRADDEKIIVVKANGETVPLEDTDIAAGDEIIVLPKINIGNLQLAKNVMDVLYKTVLSIAVPIKLLDND